MCNVQRNLLLTSELFRVLGVARGVRTTPYKGSILAARAYRDIALRQFADLDIIVPHCEITDAHQVLLDLDYRSELDEKETREPLHAGGPFLASTHITMKHAGRTSSFTLRQRYDTSPQPLDLEALLSRRETIAFAGGEAPTFSAEDLLVLLSVHGSKHFWDRLGWIADIAALLQSPGEADWESAIERARRLGTERMVFLGAELARVLLDAPLPDQSDPISTATAWYASSAHKFVADSLPPSDWSLGFSVVLASASACAEELATGCATQFALRPHRRKQIARETAWEALGDSLHCSAPAASDASLRMAYALTNSTASEIGYSNHGSLASR